MRPHGVRFATFLATLLASAGLPLPAQAPGDSLPPDRRLLVLDVGDPARPAFPPFNEAFLTRLRADSGFRSVVFLEHHDPRLGMDEATLRDRIRRWADRYAAVPLDAIVANGPIELALAVRLRAAWGRPLPIVYRASTATAAPDLDRLRGIPGSAGVLNPSPIPGVVDDILRLRPGIRHLLVVAESPGDLEMLRHEAGAALPPHVAIHPWLRPHLRALRDSVRRLPADAAVLYIAVFTDGDGRTWIPADFLAAFASASAQPVFGLFRNLVGRGIVGGPVVDPARQGEVLAEQTLSVLRDPGRVAEHPTDTMPSWPAVYDWAVLQRYRIPTARLPRDATFVGRPVRIWEVDPAAFWAVVVLLVFQSVSIAALVTSRRHIRRSELGLSALTRRLQATQEEEQARLSRELHDTLGQDLLSQALDLERFAPVTAAPDQPPFAARLRQSVVRLEGIARELNPSALLLLDLRAGLEQLAADLRVRAGLEVTVSTAGLESDLPAEVRGTVYRIVQEALANIRRHAKASNAAILVQRRQASLEVIVRDDGIGFDVARRTEARLGLLSMQERAARVGGQLDIVSAVDEGTTIMLTMPIAPLGGAPV